MHFIQGYAWKVVSLAAEASIGYQLLARQECHRNNDGENEQK